MKIINTFNIDGITNCVQDYSSLYLFRGKPPNDLSVFNISDFQVMSSFPLGVKLVNKNPCIDDDCIYLPTQEGQILGVDKFSGKIIVTLDLGSMVPMSDLKQNEDYVFSACVVPIMHRHKNDLLSLCVSDKLTGKKKYQSSIINGRVIQFVIDSYASDFVVAVDQKLCLYNKMGIEMNSTNLNFVPDYLLILGDSILSASKSGTIEIFDKITLELKTRQFVGKSDISPLVGEDTVYWATKHICKINLEDLTVQNHLYINNKPQTDMVLSGNNLYYNSDNNLVKCDLETHRIETLDLKSNAIWKPVVYKDNIIIITENTMYKITSSK